MSTRKIKLHALSAVIRYVKANRNLRPVIREDRVIYISSVNEKPEILVIFLVHQWAYLTIDGIVDERAVSK